MRTKVLMKFEARKDITGAGFGDLRVADQEAGWL